MGSLVLSGVNTPDRTVSACCHLGRRGAEISPSLPRFSPYKEFPLSPTFWWGFFLKKFQFLPFFHSRDWCVFFQNGNPLSDSGQPHRNLCPSIGRECLFGDIVRFECFQSLLLRCVAFRQSCNVGGLLKKGTNPKGRAQEPWEF